MGLFKDDAVKTEKPTPQRLGQARDKGSVPISKEFTMAGTLLVAVLVLENTGWWLIESLQEVLRMGMRLPVLVREKPEIKDITEYVISLGMTVLPPFTFLLTTFVAATCLFGYSQIGFKFAKQALGIKFERLNPASNISKLASFSSIMKTFLSFLKLCVLGSVLYVVLEKKWPVFATMHDIDDLSISLGLIADMAFTVFFWIAFIVLLMSLADIAWQRYDFTKNLMMSKQEVDDERKRNDGDPLIKSRLKSARMEIMKQRMMEAVPDADVVITNPTHFSVAIKYERGDKGAPEVVAKGVDDLAMRIREIATENDVPLMEDPPLARALFRAVKVGQQIPERFYRAIAAVLSHVYRLKEQVA